MFRPYIDLYIDGKKVDFTVPIEIFMTYAHNDLHNPTIVKNSFSKTVRLDGTPNNNRIFGCFGNMERISAYADGKYSGAYFNPSKRTDFILVRNGEILERGYVKLDKVTKKGGSLSYDITLYGGLGQFLYGLSFKEDGERMKLSDLTYDYDIDFEVNKDTVMDAWNTVNQLNLWQDDEYAHYHFINFAPCYNGIPENFTADKVAIDLNSFKLNAPELYAKLNKTVSGYNTVNGWVMGELKKEYDEWQTKDLRSYLQRPVIRFKSIINACCKPENNGGYEVDLDDEFFSYKNPYYEDAWMTLPLLTEIDDVKVATDNEVTVNIGEEISLDGIGEGRNFNITAEIAVGCNATSSAGSLKSCYNGTSWDGSDESAIVDESTNFARYIQLVAYDYDDRVVGGSNVLSFYTINGWNRFEYSPAYKTSVSNVSGTYIKQSDGTYRFNNQTYKFTIKDLEYTEGMYFKVVEKFAYDSSPSVGYPSPYVLYVDDSNGVSVSSYLSDVYDNVEIEFNNGLNWFVNKDSLLNSEHTPCDYFLGYLKMFNLHIWCDNIEKKVYVRQRKNYFTGEKVSIDNFVDRDSEIVIKPIVYDAKWYNFGVEYDAEGILNKTYKDNNGFDYGIMKVDTNYNFDSSSKDLLEGIVFKGAVMNRGKSKYYTDVRTDDGYDIIPPYTMDGVQTFLFNSSGDTAESAYFTPKSGNQSAGWWKEKQYDIIPKPDFRNKDGNAVDGANVLLFYNGRVELKDTEGAWINFGLSDDIVEFERLNEGEPCWIWSMNWDYSGTHLRYLPMFSRYKTNANGWVTHSWDFGTPKQLYVPDYSIDSSSDIYTQYWKSYINDEFNADTREVDLKVRFQGRVNPDFLMNFVYFDGCWWKIMEITDYNPCSQECTKVKLVKVQDINNYLI